MTAEPRGIRDEWDPRPLNPPWVVADLLGTSIEEVFRLIDGGYLRALGRGDRARVSDAVIHQFIQRNPQWKELHPKTKVR